MRDSLSSCKTMCRSAAAFLLLIAVLISSISCRAGDESKTTSPTGEASYSSDPGSPCAAALAPHSGNDRLDREIIQLQQEARRAADVSRLMEQLGWRFVAKARLSYDPGYYKLAEACARCIESRNPRSPEALLLRGHALHNLHRFQEAEALARELVTMRGSPFDYGLLGDALMEQGRLSQAVDAYQKMVDLKPNLQSYSRAAHVRWLKGDLKGALELIKMAVKAGSFRDRESLAWAYSRLALYELQAGSAQRAMEACNAALSLHSDYAPALLMRGRSLLAEGKQSEAIAPLKRAAELNPLPEYQWALAEALRAIGRNEEASSVEAQLIERGAGNDPRTYALYLATRGDKIETALSLAEQEIKARSDVFTLDALAWSLFNAGRVEEARPLMNRALAEGTQDARLFYHAGVIALKTGQKKEARRWFNKALAIQQMLLPSEREQLSRQIESL